jgi:hypothetical protein
MSMSTAVRMDTLGIACKDHGTTLSACAASSNAQDSELTMDDAQSKENVVEWEKSIYPNASHF